MLYKLEQSVLKHTQTRKCLYSQVHTGLYSQVHTGYKVESNTVDFVESRQVHRVALAPYTLATKSKGRLTFGRQSRPYRRQSRPSWRQCRPRQAVEFKLLPICRQNRRQSRPYRQHSRPYRPVHTGDKVDCCRNRRQIGDKVDHRRYGRLWRPNVQKEYNKISEYRVLEHDVTAKSTADQV